LMSTRPSIGVIGEVDRMLYMVAPRRFGGQACPDGTGLSPGSPLPSVSATSGLGLRIVCICTKCTTGPWTSRRTGTSRPIQSLRRSTQASKSTHWTAWFAMEMDCEIDLPLAPLSRRPVQICERDRSWDFTRPRQNCRSGRVMFRARERLNERRARRGH
jgi:hypothetical protein